MKHAVPVILITLLGAVLRVTSPGLGPLWRDEAQFLHIVDLPTIAEMLRFLRLHESHPPLFYLMIRGWRWSFGNSTAAAQALPLLLSIALVPLTYVVGSRALSRSVGMLAALMVAVSPMLIFTSVQVRPYALLGLLALGSCFALWRAVGDGGWGASALYMILASAMLYTHHFGWLLLAAQVCLVACCAALPALRPSRAALARVVLAWLAVSCAYLPMLSTFRYQLDHAGYPPAEPRTLFRPVRQLLVTAFDHPWEVGLLVMLTLIAAPAIAYRLGRSGLGADADARRGIALLALPASVALGGGLMASLNSRVLLSQTLMILAPFAMILLAFVVVRAHARRGIMRIMLAQAAIGALVLGWLIAGGRVKSNVRAVATQVRTRAQQSDLVLIVPGAMASSFNYYYRGPQQQIAFPEIGMVRRVRFDDAFERVASISAYQETEDSILAAWRRRARVWFITVPHQDPVIPERHLPRSRFGGLGQADLVRAVQLGAYLDSLYGAPESLPVPHAGNAARDGTRALLYAGPNDLTQADSARRSRP